MAIRCESLGWILLGGSVAVAMGLYSTASRGNTASPSLIAAVSCHHRASKGRVSCELEMSSPDGWLQWTDLVVVFAPHFAAALRERVAGPPGVREKSQARIEFSLLATDLGRGKLVVRGRAVVCRRGGADGADQCEPVSSRVSAEVLVGPAEFRGEK